MAGFQRRCEAAAGRVFESYADLWAWSVTDGLEACWEAVWQHFDVRSATPYARVLSGRKMPGAVWFPGASVNYAAHALRHVDDRPDQVAIVGVSQTRQRVELTWAELAEQVRRVRAGFVELGVERGDRVAGYLPNTPEAVVAFLAAASIGAVWTSCAPEFGVSTVLDRFGQVEPRVLIAVDGYRYGAKDVDRTAEVDQIRGGLPSVEHTVIVANLGSEHHGSAEGVHDWNRLGLESDEALDHELVPTNHPLYVLYSSGTTGPPKAIVHGHGGILIEHLKVLGLHADMGPDDTFFWFTTTGWMMWNYLVSGLLVGARLVVFDGDPGHPRPGALWELAASERVTWCGIGSPYATASRRAGLTPAADLDMSALRAVGTTGAPLPTEDFDWIHEHVSPSAMISPISGGTDVCSAFVGGTPTVPVWRGEIPCRYLGAAVESYDEDGTPMVGSTGELVVTQPMPSMPVGFWADDDGSRYRAAYFEHYPRVWRHGDWITITDRGSCVISGRSDSTLNRGGVRIGTAEVYRVVESIEGVRDSLVVHLDRDGEDALVLFVAPTDRTVDHDQLAARIRSTMRTHVSPRHVPDEVHLVDDIPTTLSGKKLEGPVKKILMGAVPDDVASAGSLKNPTSLVPIAAVAASRTVGPPEAP
jgi:acetoacetyl-CoA synthetase